MKQQEQHDTGLYRQLHGAFDMTPEQMQRVREEIQQRAAAQDSALPAAGRINLKEIRRISLRTALSAACLLLIAGGGIRLYRGVTDNPMTQQSSVLIEEQLTPPAETVTGITVTAAKGTTTVPETTRTASSVQQTTTAGTTATTALQTAADTTQSAEMTEQTTPEETVTATETAEQTTTTPPTTTTVTTTTAETTTTTTEPDNTFEIVETPEQANIVVADLTCTAGGTVTVDVVLTEDLDVAGFQCNLLLNCPDDAPAPTLLRRSTEIVQMTGEHVIWNTPFPAVNPEAILVFGGENEVHLPAGIKLLTLEYQIPEDAAPGTVYRFSSDSLLLFAATDSHSALAARMYPGSITVG